jgi:hypothetical protein
MPWQALFHRKDAGKGQRQASYKRARPVRIILKRYEDGSVRRSTLASLPFATEVAAKCFTIESKLSLLETSLERR